MTQEEVRALIEHHGIKLKADEVVPGVNASRFGGIFGQNPYAG